MWNSAHIHKLHIHNIRYYNLIYDVFGSSLLENTLKMYIPRDKTVKGPRGWGHKIKSFPKPCYYE